ncbi:MAG: hypothetical protein WBW32_20465 [Luteibacter sp.]
MIDAVSGYVRFPDGLILYPAMMLRDLPEKYRSKEYRAGADGHRMFPCGKHDMYGQQWGVAAIFAGQIDQVWLQLQSESLVGLSLDNEWVRHRWHIDYMRESFRGHRFTSQPGDGVRVGLPWGFVACSVDLRGVQALLQVKYTSVCAAPIRR